MEGGHKLLMAYHGKPIFRHVLDELLNSQVKEIVIVLGHSHNEIEKLVPANSRISVVVNEGYKQGMTSSIQCGVKAANPLVQGYLIAVADMPKLTSDDLNLLLEAFIGNVNSLSRPIIVPTYNGQRGNPVIFHASYRNEILGHQYPEGCRQIVVDHAAQSIEVAMRDDAGGDVDTQQDYERL